MAVCNLRFYYFSTFFSISIICISELYDVNIEYCEVGSNESKFKIYFKNNGTDIESNVYGCLDISEANNFQLACVVDGIMYKSNVAFIENSIHLFDKVLF